MEQGNGLETEIAQINACVRAFKQLDIPARKRLLDYLRDRFIVNVKPQHAATESPATEQPTP